MEGGGELQSAVRTASTSAGVYNQAVRTGTTGSRFGLAVRR